MKGRKNAKDTLDESTMSILDELFADSDDGVGIALPVPCCVAIGRIFVASANLGGMVSLYRGGPNNAYIVSFRFGERKRAVEIDDGEGSVTVLEQLANGVEQAWAKVYLARNASKKGVEATKQD